MIFSFDCCGMTINESCAQFWFGLRKFPLSRYVLSPSNVVCNRSIIYTSQSISHNPLPASLLLKSWRIHPLTDPRPLRQLYFPHPQSVSSTFLCPSQTQYQGKKLTMYPLPISLLFPIKHRVLIPRHHFPLIRHLLLPSLDRFRSFPLPS